VYKQNIVSLRDQGAFITLASMHTQAPKTSEGKSNGMAHNISTQALPVRAEFQSIDQRPALFGQQQVVQKKNLAQYGLAGNMGNGGTQALIGSGETVKIYSQQMNAASPNKTAAIIKAGERNGLVGSSIAGKYFNGNPEKYDKMNVNKLDPFYYSIKVPYQKGAGDAETTEHLTMEFQHAPRFTGYATAVMDTGNDAINARYAMMYETGKVAGTHDKYTNVHDTTDDGNLAGLTDGGGDLNMDAYTKIAGEGARWECVRAHSANLKNSSVFHTETANDPTKVWGVKFTELWLRWASAFGKKYNIPDQEVKDAINTDKVRSECIDVPADPAHYCLD
jgi:hypothetical protein